jgi:hypothetical protein
LETLSKAIQASGQTFNEPILVFGSAPLQVCIAPEFSSWDVDVAVLGEGHDILKRLVEEAGLGKDQREHYVQVVPSYVFRPGQNWRGRSETVRLNGVDFLFPAALDILLAKLRRLEEKDLRAFELVIERTQHPTPDELIRELRDSYDQFYLQLDGKKSLLWENTEQLWPRIFGQEINVREQIINPVFDQLSKDDTSADYLTQLRQRLGL